VAILLDDRGKDGLWADEGPDSPAALAATGTLVLLPDVRFYGELQLSTLAGLAPEHLQHKPFSHMREPDKPDWNMAWTRNAILWGRPLPGHAVTDLQAALDFLSTRPEADLRRVRLVAAGRLAAAALFAAVLDSRFDPVELDLQGRSFDNGKLPLVPSVLRHGDVCHWAAALADRSVTLTGLAEDEEGMVQLRAAFEALGNLPGLNVH
jgi:hypothetical protein